MLLVKSFLKIQACVQKYNRNTEFIKFLLFNYLLFQLFNLYGIDSSILHLSEKIKMLEYMKNYSNLP